MQALQKKSRKSEKWVLILFNNIAEITKISI